MNIIIPFHLPHLVRARRLLEWCAWLGWPEDARWWLLAPLRAQDPEMLSLLPEGSQWITDYQDFTSHWNGTPDSDATGPNSMWQQAAKHMKMNELGRWLYLEPDSMPCRRDWYSALVFEDQSAQRPFMGCEVPAYGRRMRRMSGVGIYPQNTSDYAIKAFDAREQAFDDAAAEQFLSNAHLTDLFCYEWRSIPFNSEADLNARVPAQTAIFHGCGDGSIYPFLRKRVEGVESPLSPSVAHFINNLTTKAEITPGETPANGAPLEESIGEMEIGIPVPDAIYVLASECQRGPLNKARVVMRLKEAGIFELPKKKVFKRRKSQLRA